MIIFLKIFVLVIVYICYGFIVLFAIQDYDIPERYELWIEKYPNWMKRTLLFVLSGFVIQAIVVFTFLQERLPKYVDIVADWFER